MTTPSSPPDPSKPDKYRTDFKTLIDQRKLEYECIEGSTQPGPVWFATYNLIKPDGGKIYLGSSSGTNKKVAKELAAKQALDMLISLIGEVSASAT
jgi:hypothetical protein